MIKVSFTYVCAGIETGESLGQSFRYYTENSSKAVKSPHFDLESVKSNNYSGNLFDVFLRL